MFCVTIYSNSPHLSIFGILTSDNFGQQHVSRFQTHLISAGFQGIWNVCEESDGSHLIEVGVCFAECFTGLLMLA